MTENTPEKNESIYSPQTISLESNLADEERIVHVQSDTVTAEDAPTIKLETPPVHPTAPTPVVTPDKPKTQEFFQFDVVSGIAPWLFILVVIVAALFFFAFDESVLPLIIILGSWTTKFELVGAGPLWYCLLGGLVVTRPLLRRTNGLNLLEKWLLRGAAGMVAMSCAFFLASVTGFPLASTLAKGGILWPAAFCVVFAIEWRRRVKRVMPIDREKWTVWQMILSILLTQAVLLTFAAVPAPSLLYDVTEYHLGALADYGLTALNNTPRYVPVPNNIFARFPFPIETLYHVSATPKMLNALCVLACSLLVYTWLERASVRRVWRLLAAFLVVGHPVMLQVNHDAMIDAPVAYLVLATIYAIMLSGGIVDHIVRLKIVILAGFLAGGALCTKYTVAQVYLLPVAIFCMIPLTRMIRQNKQWKYLIAGVCAGILPIAVWYGKNIIWYNNPVEPFFQWFFQSQDTLAVAREQYYLLSHFPQSFISAEYWLTLPTRIGAISWPLLASLLAYMMPINIYFRRDGWRLAIMVIVSLLLWNLVRESQARFLLATILMAIIAGTLAMHNIWHAAKRNADFLFVRASVILLAVLFGMTATAATMKQWYQFSRMDWLTYAFEVGMGQQDLNQGDSAFYQKNLGALGRILTETATTTTVNIDNKGKLLLVYEARPWLWLHMMPNRWGGIVYNTVFDESELLRIANGARTPAEINKRLRDKGIRYILVNNEELRRFTQQYARPKELRSKGVTDLMAQWTSIREPEDFYAPFSRNEKWAQMREPIITWIRQMRSKAIISAANDPTVDIWIAPVE